MVQVMVKKSKRNLFLSVLFLLLVGIVCFFYAVPSMDGCSGKRVIGIGYYQMGLYFPVTRTDSRDIYSTELNINPQNPPPINSRIFFIGTAYPGMLSWWQQGTPFKLTYWHKLQ